MSMPPTNDKAAARASGATRSSDGRFAPTSPAAAASGRARLRPAAPSTSPPASRRGRGTVDSPWRAVPKRAVPERAVPLTGEIMDGDRPGGDRPSTERDVPERAVTERAVPERTVPERAVPLEERIMDAVDRVMEADRTRSRSPRRIFVTTITSLWASDGQVETTAKTDKFK